MTRFADGFCDFGRCLLITLSIGMLGCNGFSQEAAVETKLISEGDFALRLSRYYVEPEVILSKSRYVLESKNRDSKWDTVIEWSQDEPWSLDEFQVVTLSEKQAFFFNSSKFGITVDSGSSWRFFDIENHIEAKGRGAKPGDGPLWIEIDKKGNGMVWRLDRETLKKNKDPLLITEDYGQSWKFAQP